MSAVLVVVVHVNGESGVDGEGGLAKSLPYESYPATTLVLFWWLETIKFKCSSCCLACLLALSKAQLGEQTLGILPFSPLENWRLSPPNQHFIVWLKRAKLVLTVAAEKMTYTPKLVREWIFSNSTCYLLICPRSELISEICNFLCLWVWPNRITYLGLGGMNFPQTHSKIT